MWIYELLKFWKGEKSILGKSLNYFTTTRSDFLYLFILNLKIPDIGKNTKIPSYPSSYQNVLFIFYFQFWELFITISNFNNLCFELMRCNLKNVSNGPNERIHHSIVSPLEGKANKIPCQPFEFPCIMCNHVHWFVNCPIRFDV